MAGRGLRFGVRNLLRAMLGRGALPVLLAVGLCLGAGAGWAQDPAEAPVVGDILEVRVVGNARADEGLVFQTFGVNRGDPYQIDDVRRGIRSLYRLGLFRDIQVTAERTADGLILIVQVRENPTLLRIRYDGADKLKEDDFEEVVTRIAEFLLPVLKDQSIAEKIWSSATGWGLDETEA